jgi:hypothetical protein
MENLIKDGEKFRIGNYLILENKGILYKKGNYSREDTIQCNSVVTL